MMFPLLPLLSLLPFHGAVAQFVPPPTGQEVLRNPANPAVVVRYKSPGQDICQTKNPDQKQYAGYVQLPPDTLKAVQQDYPINSFFWFVEARENPDEAPLTIWMNGGPGSSSLLGLMTEVGPCQAVPFNEHSIGTIPREYDWDGLSNMLFLDQPNQVGYSYDTANNGSLPLLDPNAHYFPGKVAPPLSQQPLLSQVNIANETTEALLEALWSTLLINGTFPSGNPNHTADTTEIAAISAWHFLQSWLQNFPQYNPKSNGVNLFAESYGGKYGPTFFTYFEEQNQKRQDGVLSVNETVEIHIESLGIVNGLMDALIQQPSYPIYANSNPYGVKAISDETRDLLLQSFDEKGGCKDQIKQCRALQETYDVHNFGGNSTVNAVCAAAEKTCSPIRIEHYLKSNLSFYDITAPISEAFPPKWYNEWLNNATVQEAVGSPVNFTESNPYVFNAFAATGDFIRGGQVADIAYLLDRGVRVALLYGDRDYVCNYLGGEWVSLAIPYESQEAFNLAGYENITLDDNSVAGQVRQHGNFSFMRIYQAGHLVPTYQPHASYTIFERILNGKAISTGSNIVVQGDDIYSTEGPQNTTQTLKAPPPPAPTCFIRDIGTCNEEQVSLISERKAVIVNGVVVNSNSTSKSIMAPDDVFAGPGAKFGDGPGKKSESEEKEGFDSEGPGDAQNLGDISGAAGRHIMVLDTVVVMFAGIVVVGAVMLF